MSLECCDTCEGGTDSKSSKESRGKVMAFLLRSHQVLINCKVGFKYHVFVFFKGMNVRCPVRYSILSDKVSSTS